MQGNKLVVIKNLELENQKNVKTFSSSEASSNNQSSNAKRKINDCSSPNFFLG